MKISFEIDDEIVEEFNQLVPWGMKSEILRSLMKGLLAQIKSSQGDILGPIISNSFMIVKTVGSTDFQNLKNPKHSETEDGSTS